VYHVSGIILPSPEGLILSVRAFARNRIEESVTILSSTAWRTRAV